METLVISLPPKLMRPESGTSCPLSCAIKVVLPAPFGPMTACNSPSGIPNVRSSVATMPPKRFARPSTRSKSAMAHLPQQTGDSPPCAPHDQKQQRPEDDLPVFGDAREHFLQHEQRHCAEQWAEGGAHSTEHNQDDDIASTRPIHHCRADEIGVIGKQRPGKTAQRPGNDKTDELVA